MPIKKLANKVTTISFKIPTPIFNQIKRVSEACGMTMSEFIRNAIEGQFTKPETNQDPEWFKYLGKFEVDEDLKEYNKSLNK